MGNVWDIPAKPQKGDANAQAIYAGVGKALSAWEQVDLELSVIYAVILELSPPDACRRPEYAKESTFVGRATVVERAWELRAQTLCSQDIEGDFCKLLYDLRRLVLRRNDIAHGIVVPLSHTGKPDKYVLFPAMYRDKRFNQNGEPHFAYSSVELDDLTRRFTRMILRCVQVHHLIALKPDLYPELRHQPPPAL